MSKSGLWGVGTGSAAFLRACALGVLVGALVAAPQTGVEAEDGLDLGAEIPVDGGIKIRAVLPNGMRYLIHPNAKPRGAVSLVLHVDAGSVNERKSERGYAHLLEHLAFEGGKNFKPGTVVPYFASQGITFGLHQNAHTSYAYTEYSIHFPRYAQASFERGLLFLSDVARDLALDPEEVEKEKPVVVEESRRGDDLRGRLWEHAAKLSLAGSLYALRAPIGDMDVVRAATSKSLHTFHQRWYRPDRVTLIVVGDVDPGTAETAIKGAFGDWKKPAGAAPTVKLGPLVRRGVRIGIVSDKDQEYAQVRITHNRPARPLTTYGDMRQALVDTLARRMFTERLDYMRRMKSPILAYGWISRQTFIPGLEMTVCGGSGQARAWIACLRELLHEIRRVRTHGFEKRELIRAKNALLIAYESMDPPTSSEIASAHQRRLATARRPISQVTRERLTRFCLPTITTAEVGAAFRHMFGLKDCSVLLSLPAPSKQFRSPTQEDVREYFEEALADKLKTWSERVGADVVPRALTKDPEPGKVAARKVDKELGVTTLALENGVHANLHPLSGTRKVTIRVRFLGGRLEEEESNVGITDVAFGSYECDGMAARGIDANAVLRYMATRQMGISCHRDAHGITYDLWATRKDLDDAMRLLWALLSAPCVEGPALKEARARTYSRAWNLRSDVGGMANYWLDWYLSGSDPRWGIPDWKVYAGVNEETGLAWVERILQEAPMEVAIVGDLTTAEGEALACRWFGSLPKRPERWEALDAIRKVKGRKGPLRYEGKVESGEAGAVVLLAWRGISRSDDAAQAALDHAANIIDARLFETLREQQGLSYDVGAWYDAADVEGMGRLIVRLTTDPATAAKAAEIARGVVLDLAKNGPTEKELQTVSKQRSALIEMFKVVPRAWLIALTRLWLDGRTLEGVAARIAGWKSADGALLRKTLQRVVQDERYFQIIARPTAPKKDEGQEEVEPAQPKK